VLINVQFIDPGKCEICNFTVDDHPDVEALKAAWDLFHEDGHNPFEVHQIILTKE